MKTSGLADLGAHVPLVVVARNVRSHLLDVVRTDDVDGARQATQHLIGLGHRQIVHVDGGTAAGAEERRRGYRLAMRSAGLAGSQLILTGGLTEEHGAIAGGQLTGGRFSNQRPTAVFAFNDRCALGILQAATSAGWKVPADVSVVGYDDSRAASLPWVNLTTIRQDVARIAEQAVTQAISRISSPRPATKIVVAPQLVIRSSSTALRAHAAAHLGTARGR